MLRRARVVARLLAVLTAVGLVLSGSGVAAAAEPSSPRSLRSPQRTFGPSWIIGRDAADARSERDDVAAPPASVSSPWPKGRISGVAADEVLPYLLSDTPSAEAEEDIPGIMLRLYREAAASCEGLPWAVLAGMTEVASDHGRDDVTRRERAAGPLRFPTPLWREYAVDADGRDAPRRSLAADTLASAAAYLCDTAADDEGTLDLDLLRESIAHFFGDADEVEPVLSAALSYVDPEQTVAEDLTGSADAADAAEAPVAAASEAARTPAAAAPATAEPAPATPTRVIPRGDVEALIDHPNITWTDRERADIRNGLIDGRVMGLLAALARNHEITVVVLKSGHSRYIAGTSKESHHYHGRAVDITHIDGEKVSATSRKAYALALWLDALPESLRPAEVGSPFVTLESRPGFFSDWMHTGHLHIGWRAR